MSATVVLIFIRRSDYWVALFFSLFLVILGLVFTYGTIAHPVFRRLGELIVKS